MILGMIVYRCFATYTLNLAPARLPSNQTYFNSSWTSWGGSVVKVNSTVDPNYPYHLYVAFMVEHCSLSAWVSNSIVIHAVSNDPLGPFTYSDVALPLWHHNPQISQAPDGTFLLMSIGMNPESPVINCTGSSNEMDRIIPSSRLTHGEELVEMHTSSSPYGPWTPVLVNNNNNLFNGTNPSPYVFPNGTIYVASHNSGGLTISSASSYHGPYSNPIAVVPYSYFNDTYTFEDPFLWYDTTANVWRVLLHMYNLSNTHEQFRVGGYAQSLTSDAYGPWILQTDSEPVYTTFIQFNDGSNTTLSRRERPKLLLDSVTGEPRYLYTAVCPSQGNCYTLGQEIIPSLFARE